MCRHKRSPVYWTVAVSLVFALALRAVPVNAQTGQRENAGVRPASPSDAVETAPKVFDFEFTAEPLYIDKQGGMHTAKTQLSAIKGRPTLGVKTRKHRREPLAILVKQRERQAVKSLVRVSSRLGSLARLPAQADWTPAVDKEVVFQFYDPVGNPIGTLNGGTGPVTVVTDSSGIARVTFEGEVNGQATVRARVLTGPGETCTPPEIYWDIKVTSPGFFQISHLFVIGAAVLVMIYSRKSRKESNPLPPPIIIP